MKKTKKMKEYSICFENPRKTILLNKLNFVLQLITQNVHCVLQNDALYYSYKKKLILNKGKAIRIGSTFHLRN